MSTDEYLRSSVYAMIDGALILLKVATERAEGLDVQLPVSTGTDMTAAYHALARVLDALGPSFGDKP